MKTAIVNYVFTMEVPIEEEIAEDDLVIIEKADEMFEKMLPHTPIELFAVETAGAF